MIKERSLLKPLTSIPDPEQDHLGSLRKFYTNLYADSPQIKIDNVFTNGRLDAVKLDNKSNLSDSPSESRKSIIRRLKQFQSIAGILTSNSVILDLGAGRQILETELEATNDNTLPQCKIITLDIADIAHDQLLIPLFFPKAQERYTHLQASGSNLPFPDESIDLAISNMAVDFMPEKTKSELFRILKHGALALLNLHHPSRFTPDLESQLKKIQHQMSRKIESGGTPTKAKERTLSVLRHDKFLRNNNVLFSNPDYIKTTFEKYGFTVTSIKEGQQDINKWWEVNMIKP